MRVLISLFNLVLLIAVWSDVHAADATQPNTVAQAPLPGNSIYQTQATLTDQDGHTFKLADRRGKPMLVSMFYNSCQFVCPMLIDTLSNTEKELTNDERAKLSVMLMTFDPARDDVKTLKSIAEKRNLDLTHWTLARTDPTNTRKIAATLGIQYRLLADGEYNHTTVLILLDADGRVVGRTKKIGTVDPEFVKLIRHTLQGAKQ
jgi:protein SCO1/2